MTPASSSPSGDAGRREAGGRRDTVPTRPRIETCSTVGRATAPVPAGREEPQMTNRYPFPVPFGWFCVGYPEDFPTGHATPLYYWDRHLVGWRDTDGAVHVQDAFCPHLGAHLGHGGSVEGCEIRCPFHGWQFDADGTNTVIPEVPELTGPPDWSTVTRPEYTIDASVQEMAENPVDSPHFRYVQNTAE